MTKGISIPIVKVILLSDIGCERFFHFNLNLINCLFFNYNFNIITTTITVIYDVEDVAEDEREKDSNRKGDPLGGERLVYFHLYYFNFLFITIIITIIITINVLF